MQYHVIIYKHIFNALCGQVHQCAVGRTTGLEGGGCGSLVVVGIHSDCKDPLGIDFEIFDDHLPKSNRTTTVQI